MHNTDMISKTIPAIALHLQDWLLDGEFWLISTYAFDFDLLTDDSLQIKIADIFFVFYSVAIVG